MDDLHLSADARRRLEEELEWRSGERRREISAWIERAREHGDIRENADYDAAKNDQGHNEARVRQLQDMLRRAVEVEAVAGDVVEPGTVVEVRIEGDDDTTLYLVGSIEEVAYRMGFNDLSHFNKAFRARFGMTPRDWRNAGAPN